MPTTDSLVDPLAESTESGADYLESDFESAESDFESTKSEVTDRGFESKLEARK